MTAMLDAALAYAARGWPVFPCKPGSKEPATPHGFKNATTDEAQIRAWWEATPGANIGIATGAPGPDVIDVDVKPDGDGWEAFAELTRAGLGNGGNGYVSTPSGGLHAYYAGTTQRNGRIPGRHIDFRGRGGYVLAPPSTVGGRPYTHRGDMTATGMQADWAAIRAYLDPPPDPPPFTQPARDQPDRPTGRPGDDWATRTSWAQLLEPHGWRRTRDLGNGRAMWRRPGKQEGSSATTRDDGGLYVFSTSTEFEPEVPYTKFGALAVLEHGGSHAAAAAALRLAGYGTQGALPPMPLSAPVPAAVSGEPNWWTSLASRHTILDWQQLWDDTPEDEQWLVEPLLGVGRLIAVYSPPKAGKSLIALEIAAAVATGRPVLSQPAGEPRKVLYVDLENSRRDLRDRLDALGYKPADLGNLAYLSFPSLPALNSAAGGRELLALAIEHGAVLVIIDTVSRVISGKENDADTFNELYYYALAPLKGRDIAVMRLDHAGKDLSKGQRGSSSKDGDVDQVWALSAAGPVITLRCERSRTLNPVEAISLRRETGPLRHVPTSREAAVTGRVQELMAKLDELDVPRDWGRDRCQRALNQAGVPVDKNVLGEAIRVRKITIKLPDSVSSVKGVQESPRNLPGDHQAGTGETGETADQTCLKDHQAGAGRLFQGAPVIPACNGGPPYGGPVQAGTDAAGRQPWCTSCGEHSHPGRACFTAGAAI